MSQSEKPAPHLSTHREASEGAGKKASWAKRPGPNITVEDLQARFQKGVSRVGTIHTELDSLPLSRATSLSALLHVVGPVVLTVVTLALLWLLSWLLHFNFWDLFQSHQKPDLEFTLVQDTKATRPDKPKFKGNFNQRAGGTPKKSQPLKAIEEPPQAAAKKSEPPKPQQPAVKPQSTQPAVQPKPLAEKAPDPQKTAEKPAVTPTIKTPSKEKPASDASAVSGSTAPPATAANGQAAQPASQGSQFSGSDIGNSSMGNPQAGNSPSPGVDVAQDIDFGPFMADLERRIKRNWVPPRGSESRKVVLMLFIARDGNVIRIDVKKSSGDTEADESAKQAVVASLPFLALPPQFKEDILPVEFAFDYNVLNPKNPKQALKW
ncbi:TonB C-terminal domain-containing protein [Vampirovibrio chlorellavorus]|uniref:TonB C-terminal domain-containing protein n=1 Tax=Vampirovibrio chlorellavorus TaxID=758823 RepID=UPI0026EF86E2|nr:TonB C-terminal domain-containing protein [Vampirovibrio chlorellavorus]